MATRSFIGYRTQENRIIGVYHHWDGYPSGIGNTLLDLVKLGDVDTILQLIIKDYPSGWSSLNGWDGNERHLIGTDQYYSSMNSKDREKWSTYGVFYDGQRADPEESHQVFDPTYNTDMGQVIDPAYDMLRSRCMGPYEYYYVIDPEKRRIEVYSIFAPLSIWYVYFGVHDMPMEN